MQIDQKDVGHGTALSFSRFPEPTCRFADLSHTYAQHFPSTAIHTHCPDFMFKVMTMH